MCQTYRTVSFRRFFLFFFFVCWLITSSMIGRQRTKKHIAKPKIMFQFNPRLIHIFPKTCMKICHKIRRMIVTCIKKNIKELDCRCQLPTVEMHFFLLFENITRRKEREKKKQRKKNKQKQMNSDIRGTE